MIIPTFRYEEKLWKQGYRYVVGLDEVGRGAWAGPVVVGAVIFSPETIIPQGIRDSKELTPKSRTNLAPKIKDCALDFSFGVVEIPDINKHGIGNATHMAMRKALKQLKTRPDYLLIDAFYIKHLKKSFQMPIKKGDKISTTIAAASIIAKDFRDSIMKILAKDFSSYNFEQNKGYGTKNHQEAIKRFGFSAIHRTSFNLNWLFQDV